MEALKLIGVLIVVIGSPVVKEKLSALLAAGRSRKEAA